jgi:hypothetical protein
VAHHCKGTWLSYQYLPSSKPTARCDGVASSEGSGPIFDRGSPTPCHMDRGHASVYGGTGTT